MRYLSKEAIETNLSLGKPIEQWLGSSKEKDYSVIRWLRVDRERSGDFSVTFFETFDDGDKNFLDIYEFTAVEPDELYGRITSFPSFKEALTYCYETYGAQPDKFINAGMIQEEYRLYVETRQK